MTVKTGRRLLIGCGTLLILVLVMGLAFASDSAPAEEPEKSPFFEATLQQAVDELDGKTKVTGSGQIVAAAQPTQHYTSDPGLWPECGPTGYTWDVVTYPWCHYTTDPAIVQCEQPWPTQDYTWDSVLWPELCGQQGITQDPGFWCDPMWTSDPAKYPQCEPGYTQNVDAWPQCSPRFTLDPQIPQCEDPLYTTDPQVPECNLGPTSDPYIWPDCHYTSDPKSWPECVELPPYPTKDYTTDPRIWAECAPDYTSDPNMPQCVRYTEDPVGGQCVPFTQDPQALECQPNYTVSPVLWPWCHYTSDPEVPACEGAWPTKDYTWDAGLWKECDPTGAGITRDADMFWCSTSWTTDPAQWPGCDPVFTRNPEQVQCDPAYTYDPDVWKECATGLYTYNPDTWQECAYFTADARIWPECHYTSDPEVWPECVEEPAYPTKDYTSDPRIWPECDLGVPANYTTDPQVYPECHYTSDAPIWPECEPSPESLGDLGDAPDSTNHSPNSMTAYPAGGPPGVIGRYPTVFDPLTGLPKGPLHQRPRGQYWLGPWVTAERDADLLPDEDGVNNIQPVLDQPDTDGRDDGVIFPVAAPHCVPSVLTYTLTITPGGAAMNGYVNVWFDWLRDGDWDDVLECPDGTLAPEWAVQNQLLPSLPPGSYVFHTPAYMPWSPPGADLKDTWMRISVAEAPAPSPEDGRGPDNGYRFGETEDYYFEPTCPVPAADFIWDPPTICPTTTVQFWDTSTNSPTSWSWDFGDGMGTSSSQNPSYSYSAAGVGSYDVTLKVSNVCGSSIVSKTLEVIDCTSQDPDYDIYVKDNDTDDGSVASSSPWWVSPDIWVRNDGDCTETDHQNPIPGTSTTLCVRVRNRMTTTVDNITVNLYWTAAALGTSWPGSWSPVGSIGIASLAGGSTTVRSVGWSVPYFAGHACFLARADAPHDPIGWGPDTIAPVDHVPNNNNIAQKNTSIADAPEITSCGFYSTTVYADTIYFDAVNTTDSNKTVDIVFESADFPLSNGTLTVDPGSLLGRWSVLTGFSLSGSELLLTGFPAKIGGVTLTPHEVARMALTVEAEIDEHFAIDVTEKSGSTVLGGIEYVRDLPRCVYLPIITKGWNP